MIPEPAEQIDKSKPTLELAPYAQQFKTWPQHGKCILAHYNEKSVVLYQAYKESIADVLVKHQCYHHKECQQKGFSLTRMTWMKPNFMWMMYRSGWATKHNQEHVLAIRVSREGFDMILLHAYHSLIKTKNFPHKVRLQWDPDYWPNGDRINSGRRAIQLGIPPDLLIRLSKEHILAIEDITGIVREGRSKVDQYEKLYTPIERVYNIQDQQLRHVLIGE